MNGILDAAADVDQVLRRSGFRYCLIGGIALQRWGQLRTTLDVDVTVLTEFGDELPVITKLLSVFHPRVDDAAEFAEQNRVVLLKTGDNVGLDISLGALPFEYRMIDRASDWTLDAERSLKTCSANDLIVQKAFAGREQDWVDVRGIIDRLGKSLDQTLIFHELDPLLELSADIQSATRLRDLFNSIP